MCAIWYQKHVKRKPMGHVLWFVASYFFLEGRCVWYERRTRSDAEKRGRINLGS